MKKLTTIFLLLTLASTVHADESEGIIPRLLEYDVEIIIFEDANARYINSEDWMHENVIDTPAPEKITELPENIDTSPENLDKLSIDEINAIDDKSTLPFQNIKPEILTKEYKRINASKEYNVLFYGSWLQTGLKAEKAFEIDIENLDNTHEVTSKNTLSGNFKLILGRYLHIYSKLDYQRKLNDAPAEQSIVNTEVIEPKNTSEVTSKLETSLEEYEHYLISNHRRMRSKVLHYIDHPLLGMLIQINPVKVSAEETAEKSAAQ